VDVCRIKGWTVSRSGRAWTVAAAAAALLWGAGVARAGGFEHPTNGTRALGRGGAFTAQADDLTALDYNPAGLLLGRGTHLMLSNNITDFRLKFTQTASDRGRMEPVKNTAGPFLLAPVFGISTDLLHPDIRVALGVYGPSAYGRSRYDPDGPQRYMLTETDIKMVFYTAAVAWQPMDEWGLGLSLHWIDMMSGRMSMVVNGSWQDIEFADETYDVEASLDVADHFNFAATLGTWFRPAERLRFGASLRFPFDRGFGNNIDAAGTVDLDFQGDFIGRIYRSGISENEGLVSYTEEHRKTSELPVTFSLKLPMVARFGIQYIHPLLEDEQLFDVELDVVWEGWSLLEEYSVDMAGYMMLVSNDPNNVQDAEELWFNPVKVPKRYRDTWSVRLGGDFRAADWVRLRLGAYYETGAVPPAYTNIDFASFDRFGLGTGFTLRYRWMDLSFGYSHIFQQDRVVSWDEASVYTRFPVIEQEPLERHKINAGKYETSYDIYSLSLEAKF